MLKKFLLIACLLLRTKGFCVENPSKPFDKGYWSAASVAVAAVAVDGYSTVAWIGRGEGCDYEAWSPMLYGRHPQPARVASVLAVETSLALGTAYLLRRHHSKLWVAPVAFLGISHARGAAHNFQNCR